MSSPQKTRLKPPLNQAIKTTCGLAVVLILVAAGGCRPESAQETTPSRPGEKEAAAARLLPGPDFELLGLSGRLHKLSDLRGKVVLVNYWATWCIPCRTEIPELDHLYQELSPEGVEILGIATDIEGETKVGPYAEEVGIGYPILLDPEAVSAAIFGGVDGYPKTFILDREGQIYSSYLGAQPKEVYRDDLTYLLEAPPSLPAQHPLG